MIFWVTMVPPGAVLQTIFVAAAFLWPCLAAFPSESSGAEDLNGTAAAGHPDGARKYPTTWMAKLFYETLVDFTVARDLGSSACQRQTQMYLAHLRNDTNWAVQMSDSWSRYPNGLLVGTSHQMGVYEECVDVHQPVRGMYCVPSVRLETTTGEDFTVGKPYEPQTYDHAWREILGFKDYDFQTRRNNVKFGVCIPNSCTAKDLEISLQRDFDTHFLPHQVKAHVKVEPILCSTDQDLYPYGVGYYVTSSLIAFLIFICGFSTVYHLVLLIQISNEEKTNKMPEILNYFSIIYNGRNLIKYNKDNNLNIYNGIKVVTMILVLYGHKFLYFIISPQVYEKEIEKMYTEGPDFLLSCSNLIDPFFYIAGFLMYMMLIPQFSKPNTNWIHMPMVFVYKYLKIIPSYAIIMLLTTFIIPHMGNGPFWASRMWSEADKCKNNWWTNFLAISNFIEIDNQCLIVGWYISCLLQFMVIGIILVYICVKNRKVGIYIIVLLLLASFATSFVVTFVTKSYGIVRLTYSFMENPSNSYEFSNIYRPFYLRGTPFYIGLLAGFVVEELKKRKIKFSTLASYVVTLIVIIMCSWIQLYSAAFYQIDRPYNVLEQSVYSVVGHCTWSIILFCVTVCHFASSYGPLERLFNNRLLVPLGRLSYAVYLVNITVMMMIESRQRTSIHTTFNVLTDGWIVGSFRTYYAGILLHIFVEAPMGHLVKKLLYPKTKNDDTTRNLTNYNNTTEVTEHKNSTYL